MKSSMCHVDRGEANLILKAEWQFQDPQKPTHSGSSVRLWLELGIVAAILVGLNLPGLSEATRRALSFSPALVAQGEWWRLVTHPLVHVSWYHFLLDGLAFLALYKELMVWNRWRRFLQVGLSAAGSLGLAWALTPEINTVGLSGLSGVAHGLMAVSALHLMCAKQDNTTGRWVGGLLLGMVVGKSLFELVTGESFLFFLHFGLMGTPVVCCHLGGVLGGIVAWTLSRPSQISNLKTEIPTPAPATCRVP